MLKITNILFFLSLLAGLTILTSDNLNFWYASFDDTIVFIENNEESQDDDSSEEKPLFISSGDLSFQFISDCTKIEKSKYGFVIRLKYPIWQPPKIS